MLPAEHRQLVRCRLSQDRFEGAGGLANRQHLGHSVLEDRGPDGMELRARRVGLAPPCCFWLGSRERQLTFLASVSSSVQGGDGMKGNSGSFPTAVKHQ